MNDRMTMEQINERYQNEWVFIEDPISDDVQEVQSGIVRFHGKDCDEVERMALEAYPHVESRPRRVAFLYIGEAPEDLLISFDRPLELEWNCNCQGGTDMPVADEIPVVPGNEVVGEPMSLQEIEARFPCEWILIEDPVTDSSLEVLSGRVAWHSADRDEVYRKSIESKARRVAYHYTGPIPEDISINL